MKKTIIILPLLLIAYLAPAQAYTADWESIDSRPVPEWFEDAKFGIFIHWGVYAVPSWAPTKSSRYFTEWYWWYKDLNKVESFIDFHNRTYGEKVKYQDFAGDFKAELFDPDLWAQMFSSSGAKYVVLTSKHHDGFALWPSMHSWNWNSVDVGPHRDICGELTRAVRSQGMKMGFYYSLYEWLNPLYLQDPEKFVDEHMLPQLKDLVSRYEPEIVWPDGEWDHPSSTWRSEEFLAWLYNESPVASSVVVNDRWGKETRSKHGGYFTTEYDEVHGDTSEGVIFSRPWEECRGMGGSFGYNRNENLDDYSTSTQLIHMLIDKTARGGNLLLNVGPTADGRIPVIQQQRLYDIGEWLKVNGEAIYGTRRWQSAPPIDNETEVFFTVKGSDLYVITTSWPEDGIIISGISGSQAVTLLGSDTYVRTSAGEGGLRIEAPGVNPGNMPCGHAWVFKVAGVV